MSILEYEHGLHAAIPESVYHARIPGIASKSVLDLVDRSLAHYRAWLDGATSEETEALAFGRATHCAILEPDVFAATYVVEPDFGDCRFKEAKATRDAWRLANANKTLITAEDARAIEGIAKSIHKHKFAARMFSHGASEVSMRWQDPETKVECKGRVDYYCASLNVAYDLKTTDDAREGPFSRSIANYRYHVQHALYADAFRILGRPLDAFAFVAVEKKPPHNVKVYVLDREDIEEGWEDAQENLASLAKAFEEDNFPGYPEDITVISRPNWARR